MKNILLLLSLISISQNVLGQFQACNSSTNKDLYDLWFIDQNIGIAVGDSGTIVRSIDGGLTWNLIMSNDTVNFKKVNFFDELNGVAIGSDIYRTNDAGLTWSNIPHSNNQFYDIEILNQTTCIISGYPVGLIKSINTGLSFSNLVSQQNSEIGLLSFVDENIGYACNYAVGGPSPTIKTTDGGANWITISNGQDVNSIIEAMSFISETVGFKGGWYNASLLKTSDSANNWDNINYADSLIYGEISDFHIEQSQLNSYYACGWYGQIFKSTDGGDNWIELNSGVSNTTSLYGIFFVNDSVGFAVGQNGTIIKTTNGGVAVGEIPIDGFELQAKVYLEGCYEEEVDTMTTYLTEVLPLNQPYDSIWNYTGTENLSEIPPNMVDWVLVEARTGVPNNLGTGTTVIEQKAGLLLSDGSITGLDAIGGLRFFDLLEGEPYYFSIRHRNHLDVLVANPIIATPQMNYDFTTSVDQAFGVEQLKEINGKSVLYSGDINADNVIQTTDYDVWKVEPALNQVYHPADLNLDNVVQATDYDIWFDNKAKVGTTELQD